MKGGRIIKSLGVLITLFVFISASYAADTTDLTDSNIIGAEFDDGFDDSTWGDEINDGSEDPYNPGTDDIYPYEEPATDPLNDEVNPLVYYTMNYGVTQENLEDTTDGEIFDSDGSPEEDNPETDTDEVTGDNNESNEYYPMVDTEMLYKGDTQDNSAQASFDPEQVRALKQNKQKQKLYLCKKQEHQFYQQQ